MFLNRILPLWLRIVIAVIIILIVFSIQAGT